MSPERLRCGAPRRVDERSDSGEDPQGAVRTLGRAAGSRRQLHNCHSDRAPAASPSDAARFGAGTTAGASSVAGPRTPTRMRKRCDQQTDRDRDMNPGERSSGEPLGSNRMDRQKSARDQEGERQQDTRASPRRSAACPARIGKNERAATTVKNSTKCSTRCPTSDRALGAGKRHGPISERSNATTDASATKTPDRESSPFRDGSQPKLESAVHRRRAPSGRTPVVREPSRRRDSASRWTMGT